MVTPAEGGGAVEVELLGPPALLGDDGTRLKVAGRQRALLALLALAAPRPVTSDRLLDALWGDDLPADPPNALQQRISALRKVVDPARRGDVLVTSPDGYALRLGDERIDARRFARLAARGSELLATGQPVDALAELDEALSLWKGDALEGFADETWAHVEAHRLMELRRTATEDRFEAALTTGAGAELVGALTDLLERHPLRERVAGQLMLALYRGGRQADALAVYDRTRRQLVDDLGVDPGPALQTVYRRVLDQDPALGPNPLRPAPSTRVDNLPPAALALVGREDALEQVDRLMAGARLVTLTGPGGSGKTSLAIEAARRRPRPVHGTWLVELAPLADAEAIVGELASLLGIGSPGLGAAAIDLGTVATSVRDRKLLLVLDNCEHVVEPVAALVEELLAAAPGVAVLATSREPLGITGEQVWSLPTLGVPGPEETSRDAIALAPAVQLLLERVRQHDPWFDLTRTDAPLAASLVRQLDGLPLAIELAAAQLRVLSLEELATSLDDHLVSLASPVRTTPVRHRTLRGALDWSWDLLDDGQRVAWAALAVPPATFDRATAAALLAAAGYRGPVLLALRDLLDRSLLVAERQVSPTRYRMLGTIRGHGRTRLGDLDLVDRVHAAHASLVEDALASPRPSDPTRFEVDLDAQTAWLDDARAALGWAAATAGETARVQRIAGLLGWVWLLGGLTSEGLAWLDRGLGALEDLDPSSVDPSAVLWASGLRLGDAHADGPRWATLAVATARGPADRVVAGAFAAVHEAHAGRTDEAMAWLDRARTEGERIGGWPLGFALLVGGQLGRLTGRLQEVRTAVEDALGLLTDPGLEWARALALDVLVDAVLDDPAAEGAYEHARSLAHEGLALCRGRRLPELEGRLRLQLGRALHELGQVEEARRHLDEAVELGRVAGAGVGFGFSLLVSGAIARRRGELDLASSQLREAARLLAGTGTAFGTVESSVELALTEAAAGEREEAAAQAVHALATAVEVHEAALLERALEVAADMLATVEPDAVEPLRTWLAQLREGSGHVAGSGELVAELVNRHARRLETSGGRLPPE
jgi:predicted ATPase/DNA-binding SARP family transcriptional activator/tetratricopeptide (TPR) repeat protein